VHVFGLLCIANFIKWQVNSGHLYYPNNSIYSSRTEVISYCELRSTITDISADGLVKSLIWKILSNLVKHNGVRTCIYNLTGHYCLQSCIHTYLSACLSVFLSVCTSVHPLACPSIFLCTCTCLLPVCLSVCLPACQCPFFVFHPIFKSQHIFEFSVNP